MGTLLVGCVLTLGAVGVSGTSVGAGPAPAQGYIVLLDGDADPGAMAAEHTRSEGAQVRLVYRHAVQGYAATMSPAAAARIIQRPGVVSVEADQQVSITAQTVPTGVSRTFAPTNPNLGIDAVDDWRVDVDVAVLDTGIDAGHPDLNVVQSTDCRYKSKGPAWSATYSCGSGGGDGNGHGTHVAGTIGAIDDDQGVVGVAPGARLWAVKVLDDSGSGSMSAVVAGVDYVTANAAHIEVANMSLGCSCTSAALDQAIATAVSAGVTFAVAAGNSNVDASKHSPANHPDVITVSALADFDGAPGGLGSPTCRTDEDDTLANFSNWGPLVDIAAPGVCIRSTYKNGGYATISGTSMASPHVAGAAAVVASSHDYGAARNAVDVAAITSAVIGAGNLDWTDDSGDGIKERLLDLSSPTVFAPALVPGAGTGDGNGDEGGGNENPPAETETPDVGVGYSSEGGKDGKNNVIVTVSVTGTGGAPTAGASVTVRISVGSSTYTGTGTTGTAGTVAFKITKAPSGTYATDVTRLVTADGTDHGDVAESDPGFTK